MERHEKRWLLRDFGTLQFLWDGLSGEYIQIHGEGAVRDDGPWSFDVSSGSPKLVHVKDGSGDGVRLDPEELASLKVRASEDGQTEVCDARSVDHNSFSTNCPFG